MAAGVPNPILPAVPDVAVPAGASCVWSVSWDDVASDEERSSRSATRTATTQ
jgi:hypothetical protein